MAFRFPAKGLTAALLSVSLAGCGGSGFLTWEPETAAEKDLRLQSEKLQSTIGEGAATGIAIGAVIGGLLGGGEGAFRGAEIGRFLGAGAGTYVSGLQARYADREAVLDQVAADIAATNADLEATLADMRLVLEERRAALAAARAAAQRGTAEAAVLARQRARTERTVTEMNGAIEAANRREAFFGEARGLLAVEGDAVAEAKLSPELAGLAGRIAAMREIATALAQEI